MRIPAGRAIQPTDAASAMAKCHAANKSGRFSQCARLHCEEFSRISISRMIPSSKVNSLAELDALVGEHIVRESPEIHWEDSHGTFQFETEAAARKALHDPYYQNFLPDVDWTTTMVREVRIYRCYASDPSAFWKMVAAATELAGPLQIKRERGQWAASFGTNGPICAHSPQIAVCLAALASRNIAPVVDHARVERQLALIMEQPLSDSSVDE